MNPPDHFPPSAPITPETFAWRLLHRPVNHVEGYDHCAHAERYLRECAERSGLYLEEPVRDESMLAAMRAAKYKSWDKFVRHLRAWHELIRPVPCSYASFIGVRQPELLAGVEQDRCKHAQALLADPVLCSWTVRLMAGVYQLQDFPDECHGQGACIDYIRAMCTVPRGLCANVHIVGLKTIWVEPPDGCVSVTLYPPGVRFTKTLIVFAETGAHEGTMRVA